jgi:hypothetical protein
MTAAITAAVIATAGTVYASNKASKSANRAAQVAGDAEAARLAFEQEQWDEWNATYGPVQDQLANYYETLTPTMRITQGLEAHEKEMNRARKSIEESFAQRGISMSGIAAQTKTELSVASAEERARIRAAAPLEVAKEKLGFLQVGLGMNPQSGMRDALDSAAIRAGNTAQIAAQNAGIARGAMIGSFTDLAQAAFTGWMNRRTTNTTGANTGTSPSGGPGSA